MSYNELITLRNDLDQLIILIIRNMRQRNNSTSSAAAAAAATSPQGNTVVRITNYNNNTLFEIDDRYIGLLQYFTPLHN
jgi:prolipoprotein diacylglyceryltransferase